MEVRAERAGDEIGIRTVHLAAFPTPLEADLVEQLKRDGDAAISFVATDDDRVIGHVLLSRMEVEADGRAFSALGLAPVAVSPERQGSGVGAALVQAALAEARSRPVEIVFVLGEPAYYGRFGFDARTAARFTSIYSGEYLQAAILGDDLPTFECGRAAYAPAFADLG